MKRARPLVWIGVSHHHNATTPDVMSRRRGGMPLPLPPEHEISSSNNKASTKLTTIVLCPHTYLHRHRLLRFATVKFLVKKVQRHQDWNTK
jgi:hypothetical protein